MSDSTAQVSNRERVFIVDDYVIVDNVVLASIPSTMRPSSSSVIIAIQKTPEMPKASQS